ncbi:unnamed protein product [Ectocarpus fasciculatus]
MHRLSAQLFGYVSAILNALMLRVVNGREREGGSTAAVIGTGCGWSTVIPQMPLGLEHFLNSVRRIKKTGLKNLGASWRETATLQRTAGVRRENFRALGALG